MRHLTKPFNDTDALSPALRWGDTEPQQGQARALPTVRRVLPERRRVQSTLLQAGAGCGCGCCCCCCCLHSVGGLVGSGIASRSADASESQAVKLYWAVLAISLLVATLTLSVLPDSNLAIALLVLVMVLPAVQFVAGLLALAIGLFRDEVSLARLATIWGSGILGAVAGFFVMLVLFAM